MASHQIWEGVAREEINGLTAEEAWLMVADFCNLHKYDPALDVCYMVDGEPGKPGLVRYCASNKRKLPDGSPLTLWVKERMSIIDPVLRCLRYEITENNMGFKTYMATIKILPGESGCIMERSFVADPVEGMTVESLQGYLASSLQALARNIECILLPNAS